MDKWKKWDKGVLRSEVEAKHSRVSEDRIVIE
jgi:hypothetical protein